MENQILSKRPVISNCIIQSLLYWIFIPNSKIKFYFNKKYIVISSYLIVRNKYKITFTRDRSYPKYSKFLFHIKPKYSILQKS